MSPPNSQRGESEVGNQGDKVRNKADAGKASTPPQSAGKQSSKVSKVDQTEHPLAGGQWERLGAVCKGGEIRIEVHPSWYVLGMGSIDMLVRVVWCSHP